MKIWEKYNWDIWNPALQPLPSKEKSYKKISICTTCMNRTRDLKKTLVKNIYDNMDYPNVEFVVLNYNSSDNMNGFMLSPEVKYFIKVGILKYFVTHVPKYYSMAHSRNIAFKQATGHIVTNVDADNFTGKGFASFLNKLSEVCPRKAFFAKGKRMLHGRVGMYRDEFINIGGYDEDLHGYGYDDHSLMIRAMNSGHKLMWWAGLSKEDFTRRIKTPREEVSVNMENKNWRETEKANQILTWEKIGNNDLVANKNKDWGVCADLHKVNPNA